jgi:hypothetical protein
MLDGPAILRGFSGVSAAMWGIGCTALGNQRDERPDLVQRQDEKNIGPWGAPWAPITKNGAQGAPYCPG